MCFCPYACAAESRVANASARWAGPSRRAAAFAVGCLPKLPPALPLILDELNVMMGWGAI